MNCGEGIHYHKDGYRNCECGFNKRIKEPYPVPDCRIEQLLKENEALKKKIQEGLSCCCSGCAKHNQNLDAHTFTLDEIDIAFHHTLEKELRNTLGQNLVHTTLSITALKNFLKGSKCTNKNDTL